MSSSGPERVTRLQATLLFVVDGNEPVSVGEVGRHTLGNEESVGSRLATLE